jgi:hypothetical protein
MTWARIDDGFHAHPKIAPLSLAARGLFVTAISYSAHYLTDGTVPADVLRGFTRGHEGRRALRELVGVGLLVETPSGCTIHDYLDHNPSRAEIEAKRARETSRKRGQRATPKLWTGEPLSHRDSQRNSHARGSGGENNNSLNGDSPGLPAQVDEVLAGLYEVERFREHANPVEDPVRVANFIARFPTADVRIATDDAADWGRSGTWHIDDGVTSFAVALRKQVERAAASQADGKVTPSTQNAAAYSQKRKCPDCGSPDGEPLNAGRCDDCWPEFEAKVLGEAVA